MRGRTLDLCRIIGPPQLGKKVGVMSLARDRRLSIVSTDSACSISQVVEASLEGLTIDSWKSAKLVSHPRSLAVLECKASCLRVERTRLRALELRQQRELRDYP
jgi:hypothetical protein